MIYICIYTDKLKAPLVFILWSFVGMNGDSHFIIGQFFYSSLEALDVDVALMEHFLQQKDNVLPDTRNDVAATIGLLLPIAHKQICKYSELFPGNGSNERILW